MPVSLLTDIMVDTPDEQSIVTYVAQFLEHFPELEAVCWFSLSLILKLHVQPLKLGLELCCLRSRNHQDLISSPLSVALPHVNFKIPYDVYRVTSRTES